MKKGLRFLASLFYVAGFYAGAMVLILNSHFSARPEGTLSQSEATERILNLFKERKEYGDYQEDEGDQVVPVELLRLEAESQDQ